MAAQALADGQAVQLLAAAYRQIADRSLCRVEAARLRGRSLVNSINNFETTGATYLPLNRSMNTDTYTKRAAAAEALVVAVRAACTPVRRFTVRLCWS